jgi:hypothetical protein
VPDFARQGEQRPPVEKCIDRLYNGADDQLMKIQSRIQQQQRFEDQAGRHDTPPKNERTELLDSLTQEQHDYIRQMTRKKKQEVRSSRKPLSSFQRERGRVGPLFPSEKVLADDGPYPMDPITSFKRTIWREPTPAIRRRTREFVGKAFWETHKGQ